jgi:hypothetical protein
MKILLLITALFEASAGLALAVAPSFSIHLLLGASLESPAASVLARVAGMALISLGIACGLAHQDGQSRAGRGLVGAMLFYNVSVAAVLAYAGLALRLSGILLWPAILFHISLAMGCLACLRRPTFSR